MEIAQIIPHVEVLIFAADRPLPPLEIVELLNNAEGFMEDKATLDQVEAALDAIREKYNSEFYAFEVRQSGGGYQFLTKPDYHRTVVQLNGDKYLKKLSTAALETLAIIAYKQPVSKGDVEAIRGVSSDYSVQKLLEKELILIAGRNEEMPGKPLLYSTSKSFMDYFGINSPDDLPRVKEIFLEEEVNATSVQQGHFPVNDEDVVLNGVHLSVSERGELTLNELEAENEALTKDIEPLNVPAEDITTEAGEPVPSAGSGAGGDGEEPASGETEEQDPVDEQAEEAGEDDEAGNEDEQADHDEDDEEEQKNEEK